MIDIFYNGILAGLVLMWVVGSRGAYIGRAVVFLKRYILVFSAIFWAAFILFAFIFATNLDYFDRIHDIDEAVDAAVDSIELGVNPYEENVIPRFKSRYVPGVEWTYGPYNYLPLDLFTYVGLYEALGWLGSPVWFVAANLMLSALAFILLRELLETDWIAYAPLAGIVMLFYSFDNASFTLLLVVLSMYVYTRVKRYPGPLSILVMSLATLTKIFAVIPLVILILFELQRAIGMRNWRTAMGTLGTVGVSALFSVLIMLPFGIQNVLDSAVFFHTSEELRVGTSVGGTVLSEIALGSEYYTMISAALVFASVVVGMRLRSMNDRVILTTVVFLLVSVKSSLAPLIIVGIFLMLRLKEKSSAREKNARPRLSDSQETSASSAEGG